MSWIWVGIAVMVGVLGSWARARARGRADRGVPRVDDDALRRILRDGSLPVESGDEPLDMDEAARAEEEFFGESWDEPEEYRP
jgi:hypothetical protein